MKNSKIKYTTILAFENSGYSGHYIAYSPDWVDYNGNELALHVEVIDMLQATGEDEFEDGYSIVANIGVVALRPHKSFNKSENNNPDNLSLIYDTVSYIGSVPVDDKLQNLDDNKTMLKLKILDAKLKTHVADFGTVAARYGKGEKFTHPMFKEFSPALRYVKTLIKKHANEMFSNIDDILNEPINMFGNCGYETINKMIEGK